MQISWLRSEIKKKGGARKLWERAVYRRMSQECPRLQSGCVMVVSVFSFQPVFNASYASLFAMELQKLLVTEWQNHSFVSNEYVSVSCIISNVTTTKQKTKTSTIRFNLHPPFAFAVLILPSSNVLSGCFYGLLNLEADPTVWVSSPFKSNSTDLWWSVTRHPKGRIHQRYLSLKHKQMRGKFSKTSCGNLEILSASDSILTISINSTLWHEHE